MINFLTLADKIIFFNMSFYFLLLFLGKGETIRIFLLYSSLFIWLSTVKNRDIKFFKDIRLISFIAFFIGILISSIFSFNFQYSMSHLKGEPLKALITLPLVISVVKDNFRIKTFIYIGIIILTIVIASAFYSYFIEHKNIFTPETFLIDVSYNKFVFFIIILLPFSICFIFLFKKGTFLFYLNIFIILTAFISVILSGSRGGYFGFFILIISWIVFLFIKFSNHKKLLVSLVLIITLLALMTFYIGIKNIPFLKAHIESTKTHIYTFNERIPLWKIAVETWAIRPITGWGFGDEIFNDKNLYNYIGKNPPEWIGTHNIFVRILFHTGLVGFVPFMIFLFTTLKGFIKKALTSNSNLSFVLFGIASAIIGGFISHSLFEHFAKLHWLTFYAGLGIGIEKFIDENSNS